ncbi:MAG TPA: endonuclease domain-containing protein [Thermoanaerobaculia bacterium]|nr:endonuclease domain-containing protein [Thermoanaerobaculia bacterium]
MSRTGFGSIRLGRRTPSSRPGAVGRVRELRDSATPAEKVLWSRLRARRFLGLKFRRQFPLEGFVPDFCCYELRLLVEIDGGIHDEPSHTERDHNRDAYLRSLGFTILRFPNERILRDLPAVLEEIATAARLTHQLEPRP